MRTSIEKLNKAFLWINVGQTNLRVRQECVREGGTRDEESDGGLCCSSSVERNAVVMSQLQEGACLLMTQSPERRRAPTGSASHQPRSSLNPLNLFSPLFFCFFSRTDLSVDTATLLDRRSSPALTLGEKVRIGESKRMKGSEQEEHMGGNNAIVLRAS